jgi:antitoxin Phd
MNVNINNLVSISEANRDFSKVARMVDTQGTAVIMKNNAPRYVIIDYNLLSEDKITDDADVDAVAARIMKKYHKAFEELAK